MQLRSVLPLMCLSVQTLNAPDPPKQVHLVKARFLDPPSPSNNTRRGERHRLRGANQYFTKMSSSSFVWLFWLQKLGHRFWCTRLNWLGDKPSMRLFVLRSRFEVLMSAACWSVWLAGDEQVRGPLSEICPDLISCRPPPAKLLMWIIMKQMCTGHLATVSVQSCFHYKCKAHIHIRVYYSSRGALLVTAHANRAK